MRGNMRDLAAEKHQCVSGINILVCTYKLNLLKLPPFKLRTTNQQACLNQTISLGNTIK